jgi:hypothetical protein
MYDREDVSWRTVEIIPEESWTVAPVVWEEGNGTGEADNNS